MRAPQEGEMEKHRIHGLILQADAKQQQVQESIAARPRGGARDELISELIQSRLAVSRAQTQVTSHYVSGKTSRIKGSGIADVCCDVLQNSQLKPHRAYAAWQKFAQIKVQNVVILVKDNAMMSGNKPNSMQSPEPRSFWDTQAWNPQARAGVAQLVERKALNLVVKGSSPFFGDQCFLLVASCFNLLWAEAPFIHISCLFSFAICPNKV